MDWIISCSSVRKDIVFSSTQDVDHRSFEATLRQVATDALAFRFELQLPAISFYGV
jgi:hypothetical protein